MFESVTQMLEQLTWIPLSKRRENSRLILFYKIINNLAVVPHSCLEKADVRTRKKHSQKFRHIGYNVDPYGQSFFPNSMSITSAWNVVSILDFSKAFDTVPHAGLLGKLEHYGIDSKILLWITNFLNNRKQRVVVDGSFSNFADVESGVPQGTVLGPLLFLIHIKWYILCKL